MPPNVPIVKEQGINIPIIANARGFLGPSGIFREIVEYWEDFFARLVKTPSWKRYVEENQIEDVFLNSRELAPFFDQQIAVMRSVLQAAGVTIAR